MEQKKWPNVVNNLLNYATIVLIALRACDVIAWSWYIVLSPIIAKFALLLVSFIVVGIAATSKNL